MAVKGKVSEISQGWVSKSKIKKTLHPGDEAQWTKKWNGDGRMWYTWIIMLICDRTDMLLFFIHPNDYVYDNEWYMWISCIDLLVNIL